MAFGAELASGVRGERPALRCRVLLPCVRRDASGETTPCAGRGEGTAAAVRPAVAEGLEPCGRRWCGVTGARRDMPARRPAVRLRDGAGHAS
jgi:hypothetical protein